MTDERLMNLEVATAQSLTSLVGIGCQSGDVVMGLSAVRRVGSLALIFADASLAEGTLKELSRLAHHGTRVFRVSPLSTMTAVAGRQDVMVMGVKEGSLAEGMAKKLVA